MTGERRNRGKRRWGSALTAASFAAWIAFFGLALFFQAALSILQTVSGIKSTDGSGGILAVFAIFGIPVVLVVCFVTGVPALMLAEMFKLSKWWQAALVGMGIALMLALGVRATSGALAGPTDFRHLTGLAILMFTGVCAGLGAWASLWLDAQASRSRQEPAALDQSSS